MSGPCPKCGAPNWSETDQTCLDHAPVPVKPTALPMVQVVVAIIIAGRRVLIQRRPKTAKHYPDAWELPGGKLEEGETPEAALCRELKEELGVDSTVKRLVSSHRLTNDFIIPGYDPRTYIMHFYVAELAGPPVAQPKSASELMWVDFFVFRAVSTIPGNLVIMDKIQDLLGARATPGVTRWPEPVAPLEGQ